MLTVYAWTVPHTNPWTSAPPTSVTLQPVVVQSGKVDAFLNGNTTTTADHHFTNATGQDAIDWGSTTSWTLIDQVPGSLKPQGDISGDKGIYIHGGSNGTVRIEGGADDGVIQVDSS